MSQENVELVRAMWGATSGAEFPPSGPLSATRKSSERHGGATLTPSRRL